ncbi:hypothetical protein M514_14762 [Trichuris suis]|uniref:Pao retrotransposon peptidase n=1 Tax=Trichuris suis TaxID=68888 RepID=A0A085NTR2_9BILA|nr:hypothetical protein M514_14762 [Trichuris suis]
MVAVARNALRTDFSSCHRRSRGFDLKKWTTNGLQAVAPFSDEKKRNHPNVVMTLGTAWQVKGDMLSLHELRTNQMLPDTKQSLLKCAARIFDPLGLVAPFTVVAKTLLEMLWKEKVDWDSVMPANLKRRWLKRKVDGFFDGPALVLRRPLKTSKSTSTATH